MAKSTRRKTEAINNAVKTCLKMVETGTDKCMMIAEKEGSENEDEILCGQQANVGVQYCKNVKAEAFKQLRSTPVGRKSMAKSTRRKTNAINSNYSKCINKVKFEYE